MAIIESAYSNEVSATPVEVSFDEPSHLYVSIAGSSAQRTTKENIVAASPSWSSIITGAFLGNIWLDSAAGYVFATSTTTGVRRFGLDGSGLTEIGITGHDTEGRTAFTINRVNAEIIMRPLWAADANRYNYSGTLLVSGIVSSARCMLYDDNEEWLYYINTSADNVLRRARRDGTSDAALTTLPATVAQHSPTVDTRNGRIFLIRSGQDALYVVDTNTGTATTISTYDAGGGAVSFLNIGSILWSDFEDKLYVSMIPSGGSTSKIWRMNPDGTGAQDMGSLPDPGAVGGMQWAYI
jgi:hypothetical protein